MTSFKYETIRSEITAEGVRTISLNRPSAMNAMNRLLIDEVSVAFDDANRDQDTCAIIFTGEGAHFVLVMTGMSMCTRRPKKKHVQSLMRFNELQCQL